MFQFTHPVRGATAAPRRGIPSHGFQFTHPVRGATVGRVRFRFSIRVSIHAPRAGCDLYQPRRRHAQPPFQFTHPVRGATALFPRSRTCGTFQFTHPVRGATIYRLYTCFLLHVSIHAPRAGCDIAKDCCVKRAGAFQFTHPVRGATSRISTTSVSQSFNSRTPCGVRRNPRHSPTSGGLGFNSRTPCGVRL